MSNPNPRIENLNPAGPGNQRAAKGDKKRTPGPKVYFNPEEKALVDAAALAAGKPLAQWLRDVALASAKI